MDELKMFVSKNKLNVTLFMFVLFFTFVHIMKPGLFTTKKENLDHLELDIDIKLLFQFGLYQLLQQYLVIC